MTELSANPGRDRHGYVLGFLSLVLTALVLALDMTMPKGLTDDVLIVLPILVGLWMPWRYSAFVLAALATTAIAVDIFLFDPAPIFPATLVNHGLAVVVIWIAAMLIYQRNTREAALRESEARLRIISELSPAALFINRLSDAAILYHNDAGARLFGVPNEKLVGRSSLDFYKDPADRDALLALLTKDEEVRNHEVEIRKADGTLTWALASVRQTEFRGERVLLSVATDIAERKRMEQALREARDELEARVAERTAELTETNTRLMREIAERKTAQREAREKSALLDEFIEHSRANIVLRDAEGCFLLVNPQFERACGLTNAQVRGKSLFEIFPQEHAEVYHAHDREIIDTRKPVVLETVMPHADGTVHEYLTVKFPVLTADGELIAIGIIATDISESKHAEAAFRGSEERLRAFIDNSPTAISLKNVDGRYVLANPEHEKLVGKSAKAIKGKASHDVFPAEFADIAVAHDNTVLTTGAPVAWDASVSTEDGDRTLIVTKFPVRDVAGRIVAIGSISLDITDRERAEEALAEKTALLDSLIAHCPIPTSIKDLDRRYILFNPAAEQSYGVSENELLGKRAHPSWPSKLTDAYSAHDQSIFETGEPMMMMQPGLHADGTTHSFLTTKFPVRDATGDIAALGMIEVDITDREQAESALRRSERSLANAQRLVQLGSWEWDIVSGEQFWSEETYRILDFDPETTIPSHELFVSRIHPDDLDLVASIENAADYEVQTPSGKSRKRSIEYRIVRPDGSQRILQEEVEVFFDDSGGPVRKSGTIQDITERKQLERQLIQSSKLATLGEMAAGMAHELNQPLHIIRMAADGCLILMEEGAASIDNHVEQFEIISGQTQRMAEIIEHMHVFGRVDESKATAFDPAKSVEGAVNMVVEQYRIDDIGVSLSLPEACRPVLGRPVRLEQVMLNLLGNARDAIVSKRQRKGRSGSDKDRIEVSVVDDEKARRVCIAVSDTGRGIASDILERLFEPFFTTKEVGEGTGLGLSISYGIVSEMGGTIEARNIDNGTRFEIVLPVCSD